MLESFQTKPQVGRVEFAEGNDSPAILRTGESRGPGLPHALIRHICHVLWHTTIEGSRRDSAGRKTLQRSLLSVHSPFPRNLARKDINPDSVQAGLA
jgi:hypothetical protein